MQQADTISAIATGSGESGIGIIRLSGERALEVASRVFRARSGRKLQEMKSYQAVYGQIVRADGGMVDEAICLVMRAPHSYTMEDVVELQCHGGMMPLRETLSLTYRNGARPAERGEFTKRAFLNGRLDLTQAQAVMDIIQAKTEHSLEMAAGHLSGRFSGQIHELRHQVLEMIAHLEAAIDFPEDDVDEVVLSEVQQKVQQLQAEVTRILRTAHAGRILRDGLETAIIGKPNVGKSSLLNALLREQRAIVTEIPGTTRDSIEEYANIGGVPLRIIDTAGIRATDDVVERIGVEKAKSYVDRAALVLALFDVSREISAEDEEILQLIEGHDALILLNKTDLTAKMDCAAFRARFKNQTVLEISTAADRGLAALEQAIADKVYGGELPADEGAFVSSARQAEILQQAAEHLSAAERTIEEGMSADFVVIDLRSAWEKLGEITGETVGEDIIDQIFSQFCIGK